MSNDLIAALYRIRSVPLFCLPGLAIFVAAGNWWGLFFYVATIGACVAFAILLAMLFPIRGSRWSFKERLSEIRSGRATI